jgi:hypothetical protein
MTWEEFLALPEDDRGRAFQQLNPYEEPPLFEAVKQAFLREHPECGAPNEVVVGLGPGVGPYNGIGVRLAPDAKLRVPKRFMGIPVDKLIRSGSSWKRAR